MMEKIIESNKEQDTRDLGYRPGAGMREPGQVYHAGRRPGRRQDRVHAGTGRQVLALTEPVSSPTFTIVQVYEEGQTAVLSF